MDETPKLKNVTDHTTENTSANLIQDIVSVTNAFEEEYQDISTIFTNDQKDNMHNYLSKYWDRKTAEFDNYVGEQLNTIRQNQNTFELFIATKERELDQKFSNLSTNHKTMETKLNDELARIRANFGHEKNAIIADIIPYQMKIKRLSAT